MIWLKKLPGKICFGGAAICISFFRYVGILLAYGVIALLFFLAFFWVISQRICRPSRHNVGRFFIRFRAIVDNLGKANFSQYRVVYLNYSCWATQVFIIG